MEPGGLDRELAILRRPELAYESSDRPESEGVYKEFEDGSLPKVGTTKGVGWRD